MTHFSDPEYLRKAQYRDSSRLSARARLHALYSVPASGWLEWVYDHLEFTDGAEVLEVGCGNGSLWRANRQRSVPTIRLTLSDLSFGMAQEAGGVFDGERAVCKLVSDVQTLPFKAGQFDVLIANHMLYHVPDIARGVSELSRVLKPGGQLFAATNGLGHMQDMHELLHDFEPTYRGLDPSGARFGLENAPAFLAQAFRQVEVIPYENHLWVTDAEPLVDYIFSMGSLSDRIDETRREQLSPFITKRIQSDGGIYIRKSVGLVIARK